jgi:hypothetical protein
VEDLGRNLAHAHSLRSAMQAWCNVSPLTPGCLRARTDPVFGSQLGPKIGHLDGGRAEKQRHATFSYQKHERPQATQHPADSPAHACCSMEIVTEKSFFQLAHLCFSSSNKQ